MGGQPSSRNLESVQILPINQKRMAPEKTTAHQITSNFQPLRMDHPRISWSLALISSKVCSACSRVGANGFFAFRRCNSI